MLLNEGEHLFCTRKNFLCLVSVTNFLFEETVSVNKFLFAEIVSVNNLIHILTHQWTKFASAFEATWIQYSSILLLNCQFMYHIISYHKSEAVSSPPIRKQISHWTVPFLQLGYITNISQPEYIVHLKVHWFDYVPVDSFFSKTNQSYNVCYLSRYFCQHSMR